MQKWLLKSLVQNILGRLPKSYFWNGLFQKYVTNSYYPSEESVKDKLYCCRKHLEYYKHYSPSPIKDFTALELGTGWWPIVPIGLYICGAREVVTYDLSPLLRRDLLKFTLKLFDEFAKSGELEQILKSIQPERVMRLQELLNEVDSKSPTDLLAEMNIKLRIADARVSQLADKSIDLIFSTVVFQHIEANILKELLTEFRRVASNDAVMTHYIGLTDQYAFFDQSITAFNFLKYSDSQWCFLNNPIIPQTRLRISDYRALFEQTGWNIAEENNTFDSVLNLESIKLDPKFEKYSKEDLLVSLSWIVSNPSNNVK